MGMEALRLCNLIRIRYIYVPATDTDTDTENAPRLPPTTTTTAARPTHPLDDRNAHARSLAPLQFASPRSNLLDFTSTHSPRSFFQCFLGIISNLYSSNSLARSLLTDHLTHFETLSFPYSLGISFVTVYWHTYLHTLFIHPYLSPCLVLALLLLLRCVVH